jgi:hypothetical protein
MLAACAGKRRREAFDFLGGDVIKKQLAEGVPRKRVGLLIASGAPARQHSKLLGPDGAIVGEVTSGGFSPCLQKNIAMGAPPHCACLSRTCRQCVVLTYAAPSACQATSTMPCPRQARRSRWMCGARSTTLSLRVCRSSPPTTLRGSVPLNVTMRTRPPPTQYAGHVDVTVTSLAATLAAFPCRAPCSQAMPQAHLRAACCFVVGSEPVRGGCLRAARRRPSHRQTAAVPSASTICPLLVTTLSAVPAPWLR